MKSMTGFGRGIVETEKLQCSVEVKAVNSRYCDLTIKAPRYCNQFEDKVRALVSETIKRGKVEVGISIKDLHKGDPSLIVNESLLKQIKELLVKEGFYKKKKDIPFETIRSISSECVRLETAELDIIDVEMAVKAALTDALAALDQMRIMEGSFIIKDLLERVDELCQYVETIEAKKDSVITQYEMRLKERINTLLEHENFKLDEGRILQEVAIFADKSDITEEIVRFHSHVVQLKNTLQSNEPKGRKLDFLLQEVNREINTMGSKSSDSTIVEAIVMLKSGLEKIREQVQNIE